MTHNHVKFLSGSFSHLSKLGRFAITEHVFRNSCQVLTWGDNFSPDEALNAGLTPAAFEACSVMIEAMPQQIP